MSGRKKKRANAKGSDLSEEMKGCMDLLRQIQNRADAVPFLVPVDWKALEIPEYPNVVKNPMDLGTIEVIMVACECFCSFLL